MKSAELLNADALRELVRDVVREVLAEERPAKRDSYISTREAAQLASVAQGTIRRWIREGRLKPHRAGRELRVKRSELERLLDGQGPNDRLSPEELADRDFGR